MKLTQEVFNKNVENRCIKINCKIIEESICLGIGSILHLQCNIDNWIWHPTYNDFIYGECGCPKCGGKIKPSQEEVNILIHNKCKNFNYTLIKPFFYKTNKSRLELQCNVCNYNKWNPTYQNFITRDYNCPKCNNAILLDKEEALNKVLIRCNEENCIIINDFNYIGAHETILKLKCLNDNNEWSLPYYRFVNTKTSCPKCSNIYRLTQEEAENIVNDFCVKNNYKLIENFIFKNNKTKIKLQCNIDSYQWNPSFNSIKNNKTSCLKCNGKYSPTQEEAEKEVNKRCIEADLVLLEPFIYVNNKTKLKLKCKKHDKIWNVNYESFVKLKTSCSKCGHEKAKESTINNYGNLFYYINPRYNPNSIIYLDKIAEKLNITIQHALNGNEKRFNKYIVDGYIKEYNIVIEWQEKHHNWNKHKEKDLIREKYLFDKFGCRIVYIWEKEFLKNPDEQLKLICEQIKETINKYKKE